MTRGNYPDGVTGNEPEIAGYDDEVCPKCGADLDDKLNCPGCGYSTPRCPACGEPGKLVNGRTTCCGTSARGIRYLLEED